MLDFYVFSNVLLYYCLIAFETIEYTKKINNSFKELFKKENL